MTELMNRGLAPAFISHLCVAGGGHPEIPRFLLSRLSSSLFIRELHPARAHRVAQVGEGSMQMGWGPKLINARRHCTGIVVQVVGVVFFLLAHL